jgi:hypothetical protein
MLQIPYPPPFRDVYKLASSRGANISLIRRNQSPPPFVDVPGQAYIDGT